MFGASLISEQVMKMSREEWERGARQAQQEQLPLRRDGFSSVYSSDSLMVYEPLWNMWDVACDEGIKPSTAARPESQCVSASNPQAEISLSGASITYEEL